MGPLETKARALAEKWHAGQFRKDGVTPYITHCEAVANEVYSDEAKAVAWLRDVLEATECSNLEVLDVGYSVAIAVMALTRDPKITYANYIKGLSWSRICVAVKIADIRHDMAGDVSATMRKRHEKALKFLEGLPLPMPRTKTSVLIAMLRKVASQDDSECGTFGCALREAADRMEELADGRED